jgi:hypothetical protein
MIRFALIWCVLCAAFLSPWPWINVAYSSSLRAIGNVVATVFLGNHEVRFDAYASNQNQDDVMLSVRTNSHRAHRVTFPSREVGLAPFALFLSLLFATPLTWSRRLRALVLGTIAVHAFVAIRILAQYLDVVARHDRQSANAQQVIAPNTWSEPVLHQVAWLLTGEPSITVLIPIVIWIAVSFSRSHLRGFFHVAADRSSTRGHT